MPHARPSALDRGGKGGKKKHEQRVSFATEPSASATTTTSPPATRKGQGKGKKPKEGKGATPYMYLEEPMPDPLMRVSIMDSLAAARNAAKSDSD